MSSESAPRRRILVVTGNRAEYDILQPIVRALADGEGVDVRLVVTGAHLSRFHGHTVDEIERDGFPIEARIPSLPDDDTLGTRARSLATQLQHLVGVLESCAPDLVLACGDREEALAAAVACVYLNLAFAHYAAGDEAFDGNVDNAVRHAASKLANLLLVAHPRHRDLLEACGEEAWRIHVVGDSGLDRIREVPPLSEEALARRLPYRLPRRPRALVIHHPMVTTTEAAGAEMEAILDALGHLGFGALVSLPNPDAGNLAVRRAIEGRSDDPAVQAHHNLDRVTFINLARSCDLLVGNSSMGIREAPMLSLPAVNVGERQKSRLRGGNVIFSPADPDSIKKAVLRAVSEEFRSGLSGTSPYGDGASGPRIAELLSTIALDDNLRFKRFENLQSVFAP
jgi:GDP/UDP-N,N'-diacetylbacillosamine 2-epimerase (hydrolysing)